MHLIINNRQNELYTNTTKGLQFYIREEEFYISLPNKAYIKDILFGQNGIINSIIVVHNTKKEKKKYCLEFIYDRFSAYISTDHKQTFLQVSNTSNSMTTIKI